MLSGSAPRVSGFVRSRCVRQASHDVPRYHRVAGARRTADEVAVQLTATPNKVSLTRVAPGMNDPGTGRRRGQCLSWIARCFPEASTRFDVNQSPRLTADGSRLTCSRLTCSRAHVLTCSTWAPGPQISGWTRRGESPSGLALPFWRAAATTDLRRGVLRSVETLRPGLFKRGPRRTVATGGPHASTFHVKHPPGSGFREMPAYRPNGTAPSYPQPCSSLDTCGGTGQQTQ